MLLNIIKRLIVLTIILGFLSFRAHPVYLSVTEIGQNVHTQALEVSCRIFTDDFEKTLRAAYGVPIDLLKPADRSAMNTQVRNYVKKHLRLVVDGKVQELQFIGYEQIEEAIYCYFEVPPVDVIKKIMVTDTILYDFTAQQINIIHVTVSGKRSSAKLVNPEANARFEF